MANTYEIERNKLLKHLLDHEGKESGRLQEMATSPLVTLKVKFAVDEPESIRNEASNDIPVCDKLADSSSNLSNPEVLTIHEAATVFPQYSLLGFNIGQDESIMMHEPVLFNTNAPNSTFICGSQHSGKSYTLACLLESCLVSNPEFGALPHPLSGVVFHYDVDAASSVAEAAALCSAGIKVNVLLSPSRFTELSAAYATLPGATDHLSVHRLLLKDQHLDIDRMQRLMAVSESENGLPLYMEIVQQILRDMAVQEVPFNFKIFQKRIDAAGLDGKQEKMLNLRMGLLRSFMESFQKGWKIQEIDIFQPEPGTLTIVDLSDPLIDSAFACVLFDICLGLFKRFVSTSGLVIALDEAHKYMDQSAAAANFSNRLLTTIREQRHNGTRVIIATQEPTISSGLLDLCSTSIVHRFSSPDWFETIKRHLGGASGLVTSAEEQRAMLDKIINLNTGESLVFSPSSYLRHDADGPRKLGTGVMKMKTRLRTTTDSGKSKMATDHKDPQDETETMEQPGDNPFQRVSLLRRKKKRPKC